MKRISRRTVVLGSGALALSGPFISRAKASTPIGLRLDWAIYGSHAPFYLALEEKMYEKAGLNVSIGEGQGSATVAKIVGQGNDPIGFLDFTSTIRAVEQGIPLIAIERVIPNAMCVISHADAPIREPKGLESKVVAYAPSESTGQIASRAVAAIQTSMRARSMCSTQQRAQRTRFFCRGRADAIPVQRERANRTT